MLDMYAETTAELIEIWAQTKKGFWKAYELFKGFSGVGICPYGWAMSQLHTDYQEGEVVFLFRGEKINLGGEK